MSSLRQQLDESYDQHPAFCLGVTPASVNEADIRAFSAAYDTLAGYASRMNSASHNNAVARCFLLLDAVWAPLCSQAGDEHEKHFFGELGAEVRRLLGEELAFYRLGLAARDIRFSAEASITGALRLRRERHYFGRMSPASVRRILTIGAPHLAEFRTAAAAGKFTRADLTLSHGNDIRAIISVLNSEFARSGVLDALAAYSGQRVSVSGVALELSVPQSKWWESSFMDLPRSPRTLYAHLDEAIASPKAIVYLTDVTSGYGPTSCYPRAYEELGLNPLQAIIGRVIGGVGARVQSPLHEYYEKQYHQFMSSERFRRHFLRLPRELRFNSHFGWDVLPDSAAEKTLVDREHHMIGGAGTFIAFDGARLLHRGGMPQDGERIALQVVFGKTSFLRRVVRHIRGALR